jgi:hypothetical protein
VGGKPEAQHEEGGESVYYEHCVEAAEAVGDYAGEDAAEDAVVVLVEGHV